MKRIAFIPARGGSKRLPGKNILDLGGKPLIHWTIEAALTSACFDEVVVSSDDEKILDAASAFDAVDLHRRDANLASDTAKVAEVLLSYMANHTPQGTEPSVYGVLQPTSPFRSAADIQGAFALLDRSVDCVIGIQEYDFSPYFALTLSADNKLEPFLKNGPLTTGDTRKQDTKPLYHSTGAIILTWSDRFLVNRSFYKGNVLGYLMGTPNSIDIDSEEDLRHARCYLTAK